MSFSRSNGTTRMVRIGGVDKQELLARLHAAQVQLNRLALLLFEHPEFKASEYTLIVETVELSVAELGLQAGGTFDQILERAKLESLSPCPLELAAHLRLQFTDQPEGSVGYHPSRNRAPAGSLTVASFPLSIDDEVPKGFYLRRIEGSLWLRGYTSWVGHRYSPEDKFIFQRTKVAA
jgi:hypothetical protein